MSVLWKTGPLDREHRRLHRSPELSPDDHKPFVYRAMFAGVDFDSILWSCYELDPEGIQ